MQNTPAKLSPLPMSTFAITCAGAVLMIAGVSINYVSKPDAHSGTMRFDEILMAVGALCELLSSWRIWRWLKGRKSRTSHSP